MDATEIAREMGHLREALGPALIAASEKLREGRNRLNQQRAAGSPVEDALPAALFDDENALIRYGRDVAAQMVQNDVPVAPHVMYLTPALAAMVVLSDLPSDRVRQDMIASMCALPILGGSADATIFMIETWVAQAKPGDADLLKIRPSQQPDRQEGVMIVASLPDRMAADCYLIERGNAGARLATEGMFPSREGSAEINHPMMQNFFHLAARMSAENPALRVAPGQADRFGRKPN